jgi:hypothetical protein
MGFLDWIKGLAIRSRPRPLNQWFHVAFDDDRVYVRAEPPGRDPWAQDFAWSTVERIGFMAEDLFVSDGIYVLTSQRPESYVIPTEAEGGPELWSEILRRGLFDPQLAIEAMRSPGGLFLWPPDRGAGSAGA